MWKKTHVWEKKCDGKNVRRLNSFVVVHSSAGLARKLLSHQPPPPLRPRRAEVSDGALLCGRCCRLQQPCSSCVRGMRALCLLSTSDSIVGPANILNLQVWVAATHDEISFFNSFAESSFQNNLSAMFAHFFQHPCVHTKSEIQKKSSSILFHEYFWPQLFLIIINNWQKRIPYRV